MGWAEGVSDGDEVGEELGVAVGRALGPAEDDKDGDELGEIVGRLDGDALGSDEGNELGVIDGELLGEADGSLEVAEGSNEGVDDFNNVGAPDGCKLGLVVLVGLSDGSEVFIASSTQSLLPSSLNWYQQQLAILQMAPLLGYRKQSETYILQASA